MFEFLLKNHLNQNMLLTIFQVIPGDGDDQFIYCFQLPCGKVLPFSVTTLKLANIPSNPTFKPVNGTLQVENNQVKLFSGRPYIILNQVKLVWADAPPENSVEVLIPTTLTCKNGDTQLTPVFDPVVTPEPVVLDGLKSPDTIVSSSSNIIDDLNAKVTYLTSLVEAFLRREYKLYPVTCPDRLPLDGNLVSPVTLEEIQKMMGNGEILRTEQDPMIQPFAGSQRTNNRYMTFVHKDGTKYLAKVNYDPKTNQMGPPN